MSRTLFARSTRTPARQPNRCRPQVEALESRSLMSVVPASLSSFIGSVNLHLASGAQTAVQVFNTLGQGFAGGWHKLGQDSTQFFNAQGQGFAGGWQALGQDSTHTADQFVNGFTNTVNQAGNAISNTANQVGNDISQGWNSFTSLF